MRIYLRLNRPGNMRIIVMSALKQQKRSRHIDMRDFVHGGSGAVVKNTLYEEQE